MASKIIKIIISTIVILNGLLFVSNIYVIGDRNAIVEMHDDLDPSASALISNAKVMDCFIAGILYLLAAYGIIRKKYKFTLSGVIGAAVFIGFYFIELALWSKTHSRVWIDFTIFGGISLVIGIYSFITWKRRNVI